MLSTLTIEDNKGVRVICIVLYCIIILYPADLAINYSNQRNYD